MNEKIQEIRDLIQDELPEDIEKAVFILLDQLEKEDWDHTLLGVEAMSYRVALRALQKHFGMTDELVEAAMKGAI